jgi:hypothetical protein
MKKAPPVRGQFFKLVKLVNKFCNPFRKQLFLAVVLCLMVVGAAHAATIAVRAGGDLQAALNAAQPGDTIVLEGGATYMGTFILPVKSGSSYITIQSSRLAELPSEGQSVSPAQAPLMPKLVSPGAGGAALITAATAHHYQLIGIEIAPATDTTFVYDLVSFGEQGYTQLTLHSVPHHLILDLCYIHAYPELGVKRGVALNSGYAEIHEFIYLRDQSSAALSAHYVSWVFSFDGCS